MVVGSRGTTLGRGVIQSEPLCRAFGHLVRKHGRKLYLSPSPCREMLGAGHHYFIKVASTEKSIRRVGVSKLWDTKRTVLRTNFRWEVYHHLNRINNLLPFTNGTIRRLIHLWRVTDASVLDEATWIYAALGSSMIYIGRAEAKDSVSMMHI